MKVLVYTSPGIGHLFPVIPVARELARRGHAVAVRTLASGVDDLRALGLAARAIDPRIEAITHDDWQVRSPIAALERAVATFFARAAHEVGDLRAAIADERPDALLVDINTWGAAAVAEASGLPWATFAPFPLPIFSRDAPPFGPGFAPATGPLGWLRDRVAGALIRRVTARPLPRLNALRAELGLAPVASAEAALLRAPRIIAFTAEPFEYPRRDWPASVRLVGPCAWEPPGAPPALPDGPLVLVSTSSERQGDLRLVAAALEGLAGEPLTVVATAPAHDVAALRVPPNARVVPFTPHLPLLGRAVAVVCHGGMGVTQKALAAGVPVVVVPFGRDQLEVARRVELAGAGVRLPPAALGAARLREAVRRARELAGGAARVAEAFRRAGGAVAAAGIVEELAA